MEENRIKSKIIEIVDNQIKVNNPTCTKETLERLVNSGLSEKESKELIGRVLLEEMYDILKRQAPFNGDRYSKKLAMLP